jgi:hypothetical protein
MDQKDRIWTEVFRILSPMLLLSLNLLAGVLISNQTAMNKGIDSIDVKLFHHLTNDELHTPRALVVEKVEYEAIQKMRDKEFAENSAAHTRIEHNITKIMEFLEANPNKTRR